MGVGLSGSCPVRVEVAMSSTTRPARDKATDVPRDKEPSDRFDLAHSTVFLEHGPAGIVARVERHDRVEYAGPLPQATIDALAEVAQ